MNKAPAGLYPWLRKPYAQLASTTSQWHHALLLSSPPGFGKQQLVARLVELLHCSAPIQSNGLAKACGQCNQCQLHSSNTHPDHVVIEPREGKTQIAIDQIRGIAPKVLNKGLISPIRIVQINQAQLMTEAAANALLKLLEEPPKQVYFILTCDALHQLPATILSRCLSHQLPLPDAANLLVWLNRQAQQQISASDLQLAHGAPLRALAMQQDGVFDVIKTMLSNYVTLLKSQDLSQTKGREQFSLHAIDFVAHIKQSGELLSVIDAVDVMLWVNVAVLKHHHGVARDGLVNELLASQAITTIDAQFIIYLDSGLKQLKSQLIQNNGLNALLQLQQLIVNWLEQA